VIIAGERGDRPGAWLDIPDRPPVDPERDPFLEGHEDRTPPEVYAVRPEGGEPNGPGWRIRVIPNLFPALEPGGPDSGGDDPLAVGRGEPDLFATRAARGAHEVVVHTPQALDSLLDLGPDGLAEAMEAWRARMRAHGEARYLHLIVNEGREAGASLPHSHAQLYALPFVPALVARERERFTAYSDRTQGRNLLGDLLGEEVKRRDRIVAIDSEAVTLCPFASRVPFHIQLVPRAPRARFEDDGALGAAVLHETLARIASDLGRLPPFNLWVRTAPPGAERYCWRIDLLPRLAQFAGLELGTGVNLCVLAPERAAERLRAAHPAS
jgi:UDPglucose--hexose-1-phosphate uridylyltransferase